MITRACTLLLAVLSTNSLSANCCCNPHIIDVYYVPFHIDGTINPSNTTYCVTQNLTYLGGEDMPQAAITVDPGVHDIVINFNGFELDLDPSVNGINMLGTASQPITDVLIKDGVIKSLAPSSTNTGINATNFNTVAVENMRFVDERRGFLAPSQTDTNINATFRSCVFDLKGVTGASRRSIQLNTIQGLQVEDCTFLANDPNETAPGGIGIFLANNAKNALIKRSTFNGQTRAGIIVQSIFEPDAGFFFTFPSANIQIDECEFSNNSNSQGGLVRDIECDGTSNVHITNCSFYGSGSQTFSISFQSDPGEASEPITPVPSGLLVDSCTFTNSCKNDTNQLPYRTLAVGSLQVTGVSARDVIIRNSTFTHQGAPAKSVDLYMHGVEGALVENCVFDSTSSGRFENCASVEIDYVTDKSANIHLGGPLMSSDDPPTLVIGGTPVKDIIIRGNEICGGAQVGIFADTSIGSQANERITIEDNSITAREVGILFENTHSSTIIGNRVQGVIGNSCTKGVGIELDGGLSFNPMAASTSNAILDNVVTNNGEGILLKCGAQGNLVKGNIVFNNSYKHQIKEEKKHTNKIVCNTEGNHANERLSCSSSSR